MEDNKYAVMAKMPCVTGATREHKCHGEGYRDYVKGFVDDDCPYDKNTDERMSWLCGYYDAWRMEKFEKHFPDEAAELKAKYLP